MEDFKCLVAEIFSNIGQDVSDYSGPRNFPTESSSITELILHLFYIIMYSNYVNDNLFVDFITNKP